MAFIQSGLIMMPLEEFAVNPIAIIMGAFNASIRDEAARRFGLDLASLEEQEASSFVFKGVRGAETLFLKITPVASGIDIPIKGASLNEIAGELDFVKYLADNHVPVAKIAASLQGNSVELLEAPPLRTELPPNLKAGFAAYAFFQAPGIMYPDDDDTYFPEGVLKSWGATLGRMHELAAGYRPATGCVRGDWRGNDLFRHWELIPQEQVLVHRRFEKMLAELAAKPSPTGRYGIMHGDFHHGNFLVDGETISAIDFDAAEYGWFARDIANSLLNCLPMPRSLEDRRAAYAHRFLTLVLSAYSRSLPVDRDFIEDIAFFLELGELESYAYRYKFWSAEELKKREPYISSIRMRIEEGIPVVAIDPSALLHDIQNCRLGNSSA